MPEMTQLRQLAEAGTPTPWHEFGQIPLGPNEGAYAISGRAPDGTHPRLLAVGSPNSKIDNYANARKIVAAVNLLPATIELVSAAEQAVVVIDNLYSGVGPDPQHTQRLAGLVNEFRAALARFYAAAGGDG